MADKKREVQGQGSVTLTLDDDSVVECAILSIYPAGDRQYIALLPLDDEGGNEDGEIFIYRFIQEGDADPTLENIEEDEEYDLAADAFDELLDEAQFDETVDE